MGAPQADAFTLSLQTTEIVWSIDGEPAVRVYRGRDRWYITNAPNTSGDPPVDAWTDDLDEDEAVHKAQRFCAALAEYRRDRQAIAERYIAAVDA